MTNELQALVTVESGWLIEEDAFGITHWIAFVDDASWPRYKLRARDVVRKYVSPVRRVKDASEAVRFARCEDAQAFIALFDRFLIHAKATEHQWPPAIENQATPSDREGVRAEIINTPETADFMAGVPLEAAHQRERWGASHDGGKTPEDWFWLIGYLAQKALRAQNAGDTDKALHHTISTGAALANWHAAISGADNSMRPGIEPPTALQTNAAARSGEGGER